MAAHHNQVAAPQVKDNRADPYYQQNENDYRWTFCAASAGGYTARGLQRQLDNDLCFSGFREVGRQAIFIQTLDSKVLIDCGVRPGAQSYNDEFPRLDISEFNIEELDAA
jgi:hypothetical protein